MRRRLKTENIFAIGRLLKSKIVPFDPFRACEAGYSEGPSNHQDSLPDLCIPTFVLPFSISPMEVVSTSLFHTIRSYADPQTS